MDRGRARLADLGPGSYHFASCADTRDAQVGFLEKRDPIANPLGAKGVGELRVVGMNAAVANAVYHARGVRVRKTQILVNDLLGVGAA